MYPQYSSLPNRTRDGHRQGVAILLSRGRGRRTKLSDKAIVESLYDGMSGASHYTLSLDMFRHDFANLRLTQIDDLFLSVGLPAPRSWEREFALLVDHIQTIWGGATTADAALTQLVDARNDAAHGTVSDIWAIDEWLRYEKLVRTLCSLLCEIAARQYVSRTADQGLARLIGSTVRKFRGNVSGVRIEPCSLKEGDELVVLGQHRCFATHVVRIEIEKQRRRSIRPRKPINVGLELSQAAPGKAMFYRL
jgi:hypothetical protein